jgi:hypothetical protein
MELNCPMKLHLGAKKISSDIDPKDYPLMESKGIDLRYDHQITGIICEFVKLASHLEAT